MQVVSFSYISGWPEIFEVGWSLEIFGRFSAVFGNFLTIPYSLESSEIQKVVFEKKVSPVIFNWERLEKFRPL